MCVQCSRKNLIGKDAGSLFIQLSSSLLSFTPPYRLIEFLLVQTLGNEIAFQVFICYGFKIKDLGKYPTDN